MTTKDNGNLPAVRNVDTDTYPAKTTDQLSERLAATAQRAAQRLSQRPENTARAYASDFRAWADWCATWTGDPIDPEPGALATYVQVMADAGKAPSTIERALTGIRAGLIEAGMTKTEARDRLSTARDLARLLRNDAKANGLRQRRAKAASIEDLRAMIDTLDLETLTGKRDRAILLLGFSGALRRSEAAALDWSGVTEVPEGVELAVYRAKTSTPSIVAVPFGSDPTTCPVRALTNWRDAAAAAGADTDHGPLFVRIDRHGNLGRAPNGKGDPTGRMTGQAIGNVVKRCAERAGLDGSDAYTGHSLRRGFVTEARRAGADPLRIARTGGWADNSRVVAAYVEDVDRWTDHPLRGVGL